MLIPTVQVGVTKRFSMGGGTYPIAPAHAWPFWITPKVQVFSGERTSVAAGVLDMVVVGEATAGLAYVVSTVGSDVASRTIGGGLAYFRDHDTDDGGVAPVFLIGGDRRVSRHVTVVTENYVSPRGGGFLSAGLRISGRQLSADLGLAAPFAAGDFIWVVPVINFAWRF